MKNISSCFIISFFFIASFGCVGAAIKPVISDGFKLPIRQEVAVGTDLSKLNKLLTELWEDEDGKIEIPVTDVNGEEKMYVSSCEECINAHEKGFFPSGQNAINIYSFWYYQCKVIRLLQNAQPSKKTYIRKINWDKSIVEKLPSLGMFKKCKERWADCEALDFKGERENYLEFASKAMNYSLYRLAYGDFDYDGVEDVLILVRMYSLEATGQWIKLYLVTKVDSESEISIVKEF